MSRTSIGIVAPSAVVPQVELRLGVERLREEGFTVKVHPQCKKRHLFFAGTDEERAQAFMDYAFDPEVPVIWCARGGYGAARILPWLERSPPRKSPSSGKLLVGYSDAYALHEFVRDRWGWSTLHAPMPGMRDFSLLTPDEVRATCGLISADQAPFLKHQLKFVGTKPRTGLKGRLMGGNLAMIASLVGTPFSTVTRQGDFLFLEEITEPFYRIDRMIQQLVMSGVFEGVKAVILGTFTQCEDSVPRILKTYPADKSRKRILSTPDASELKSLRKPLNFKAALRDIFGALGEERRIPIAYGLPVGHGSGHWPLPLGAEYRLEKDGTLELSRWTWSG